MKKTLKSIISIMVTAALLMSAAACFTTAAAKNTFTLKVKSNFFPEKTVCYSDLDKLEDENGDVFIRMKTEMFLSRLSSNSALKTNIW